MPSLLSCKANVSVTNTGENAKRCAGLWVFLTPPGNPKKILGQAQINTSGKAEIKLKLTGVKPTQMDVLIYPLSTLASYKRIKTEKATITSWKKTASEFNAEVKIALSPVFFSSMDWLDEMFTVEGRLLNRFTDPQTEIVHEIPIFHGLVKIFDIDKQSGISLSCKPDALCRPSLLECIPKDICTPSIVTCLPTRICRPSDMTCIPSRLCAPKLSCLPNDLCSPTTLCTPSLKPECGPWVENGIDFEIYEKYTTLMKNTRAERQGCCGSSNKSAMKPFGSPAMAVENAKALSPVQCLPYFLNKTTYSKTQLSTTFETESDGHFWFQFARKDFFEAAASSTHTEDSDWDEFPDILFEAQLGIEGSLKVIYSETNNETRWNKGLYTYVDLYVDGDLSLTEPDLHIDSDQSEVFLFHGVGNVEPGWINSEGIIKSAPAATGLNEYVFGGRMNIKGQFNNSHHGKYYQVQYQRAGESQWHVVTGEQWYYSVYIGENHWETRLKSPVTLSGLEGCYEIPDYTDMNTTQKELILPWTSYRMDGNIPRYPNGHYRFKVNLIENTSPGNYALAPVSTYDPMTQILNVTIDNNWPIAQFSDTMYVGEKIGEILSLSPVEPCGFVARGPNRYLILNFTATDLENHFRHYIVQMNRGSESYITIPSPGLPNTITTNPSLPGFQLNPSSYTFHLPSDNFPNGYVALNLGSDPWLAGQSLKQCAYNFTLTVYDRVTNGYGHIHWSQHPVTLTITE